MDNAITAQHITFLALKFVQEAKKENVELELESIVDELVAQYKVIYNLTTKKLVASTNENLGIRTI